MGEGLKRARAATRATRPGKITKAKAARLVAAMDAVRLCADCPAGLLVALDDARAEISPWYDGEEGRPVPAGPVLKLATTGKGTADIIVQTSAGPANVGTAKAISAGFWEADLWRAHPSMGPQGLEGRGPMAHGKSGLRDLLVKSIEDEGPWWE